MNRAVYIENCKQSIFQNGSKLLREKSGEKKIGLTLVVVTREKVESSEIKTFSIVVFM